MKESTADPMATQQYRSLGIALYSESYLPVQNGVVTSILTLIRTLRRRGHQVSVFAPDHPARPMNEEDVVRAPSFTTPFTPDYPLAYPVPIIRPRTSDAAARSPDLIHTHTPFSLGTAGARFARRKGLPLVSTYHTLYSEYSHYAPVLPQRFTRAMLEAFLPW